MKLVVIILLVGFSACLASSSSDESVKSSLEYDDIEAIEAMEAYNPEKLKAMIQKFRSHFKSGDMLGFKELANQPEGQLAMEWVRDIMRSSEVAANGYDDDDISNSSEDLDDDEFARSMFKN